MMRRMTWCLVAGSLVSVLPAQVEKKQAEKTVEKTEKPAQATQSATEHAAEQARLRERVQVLEAENAKLKAEKLERTRLQVRPRQVEPIALAGPAPARLDGVQKQILVRALAKDGIQWIEAKRIAPDDPYGQALAKLDAARDRLSSPEDDAAALRAVDEMSKVLMEVRAQLWKRLEAARKKAAERKRDKK